MCWQFHDGSCSDMWGPQVLRVNQCFEEMELFSVRTRTLVLLFHCYLVTQCWDIVSAGGRLVLGTEWVIWIKHHLTIRTVTLCWISTRGASSVQCVHHLWPFPPDTNSPKYPQPVCKVHKIWFWWDFFLVLSNDKLEELKACKKALFDFILPNSRRDKSWEKSRS